MMSLRALILVAFIFVAFEQAQANLVSSLSTDSVFVCNAGIKHTYAEPISGTDNLVVQFEDPTMPADSEARYPSQVLTAPTNSALASLFSSEVDLWTHQVIKNQFDFSTEKFGAIYYLDLCYRGPEKQVGAGSTIDLSEGVYALDLSVNLTDPTVNGKNYRSLASLATSVEVMCDLRLKGSSVNSRENTELGVAALEKDSWYLSNQTSWNSNALNFQVTLNDNVKSVPRFCKIRVSFMERATSSLRDQSLTPRDINLFVNIDRL